MERNPLLTWVMTNGFSLMENYCVDLVSERPWPYAAVAVMLLRKLSVAGDLALS